MEIILIMYIILQVISDLLIELLYRLIIKFKNINSYKSIGELERNINVKYTPAMVSMLYDNRIEPRKDIIAILLNLNLKGYISFYKDKKDGKYKIKPKLQDNSIENMCIEEKYIYEWLIENKKFNFVEWVNIIKNEYNKLNFLKSRENKTKNIILIIMMFVYTIAYVIEVGILAKYYSDNTIVLLLGFIIIPLVMIITIMITNNMLKNSFIYNYSNNEVQKWTKFKRFMHNYTLIEDKNLEAIAIYEKYMPYSMALNVNKKYKNIWKDIVPKKERFKIMLHYSLLENILLKPILKLVSCNDFVSKYYS